MSAAERRAAWLLPAAVLAVHGASLLNGFALDDLMYITQNPLVRGGDWTRFFWDRFSLAADPELSRIVYRPLQGLSYALNAALTGPGPLGFHALDLLLHAANSWLVFAYLARRLGPGPGAWAGALLFALHPAQAQSVAYASARCGPLSFLFGLSAVLAAAPGRPLPRSALALLAASLLSKESGIAWLPVLLADDWVFGPKRRPAEVLRRLAPAAAVAAAYLVARRAVLGATAQRGPWEGAWGAHALVAGRVLLQDLGIAAAVVPLREPHGFDKGPAYPLLAAAGAASYALIGAAGLWGTWRRRAWGLAALWFWTALLPVSQLVPFTALAADRFLYAPLGGAAVLAACVWGRASRAKTAAGAALALVFAALAVEVHLSWRGGFPLALHAVEASGGEAYASLRLAGYYLQFRQFDKAEALIAPALGPGQLSDIRRLGLKRLGTARLRQGRRAEAAAIFEECLRLEPEQPSVKALLAQARGKA